MKLSLKIFIFILSIQIIQGCNNFKRFEQKKYFCNANDLEIDLIDIDAEGFDFEVLKGIDFENIEGFPNCWGWGFEDIVLQERCLKCNLLIDRSHFYNINDKNFIDYESTKDSRVITENDLINRANKYEWDCIKNVSKIKYEIDKADENMINILNFSIPVKYTDIKYKTHTKNTRLIYKNKRKQNLLMNNILKKLN